MRKQEKKYLAVLLACSMIMGAVPFDVVPASASEIPWEQTVETDETSIDQGEKSREDSDPMEVLAAESENVEDRSVILEEKGERNADIAGNTADKPEVVQGGLQVHADQPDSDPELPPLGRSVRTYAAMPAASDFLDIGECGANLTYVLDNNGVLNITGEGEMTNYSDVSSVPWFSYRSLMKKVVFSGNITNIGAYAFDYCVNLTSILIPDSITNIGAYSFYGCSGLKEITIPKSVTGIGASAFYGCTGITTMKIPNSVTSIGASAFAGCTNLTSISIPESVTSIGDGAFDQTGIDTSEIAFRRGTCGVSLKWSLLGNHKLYVYGTGAMTDFTSGSAPWFGERDEITEVILSEGVTGVGAYAFENCKEIAAVSWADTVVQIGKNAFAKCESVIKVDLNGIEEIGESAFAKSGLQEISINSGQTVSIGNEAFLDCISLKTVRLEQGFLQAGDRVWKGCTSLESLTVSADFDSMGGYLFADCTKLSIVSWQGQSPVLGSYMFSGCTALAQMIIPTGIQEIGSYAFYQCTGITEISLPDTVTSIGAAAFSGCTGLASIHFSESLESIGEHGFLGCKELTSVVVPDHVTSLGSGVFSGCSKLERITLPFVGSGKTVETVGQEMVFGYIFGTAEYTDAIAVKQSYSNSGSATYYLPKSLQQVTVTGGEIFYGAFDHCTGLTNISLPAALTGIGSYAFRDCTGLKDLQIPAGVTEIGEFAFHGCTGFDGLVLPEGTERIGSGAFSDCTSLVEIDLPEQITRIESKTFQGCSSLQDFTLPKQTQFIGNEAFQGCEELKGMKLPESITELGSGVFKDCVGLQSMELPANISILKEYSFSGCTNLQKITIEGEITEIGSYSFAKCELLETIEIPASVTEIGSYAFSGCSSIKNIRLPQEMTKIGNHAFKDCVGFTSIQVPGSVTVIGSAAFSGCSALETLTLPFIGGSAATESASASTLFGFIFGTTSYQGGTAIKQSFSGSGTTTYYIPGTLTEIEITGGKIWYGSFSGCNGLESIRFSTSEEITEIGAKAFLGCTGVKSMTLPEGVKKLGDYAFSGCTGLETISGLQSLEVVGSYAFQNCSSMKNIILPETVTTVNTAAFSGCSNLESMTLPFVGSSAESTVAAKTTLFGHIFGSVNYPDAISVQQKYSSSSSIIYYIPASLKSVTITGGRILYGAFYNCSGLKSVILPEKLTEIGDYAFYHCTGVSGLELSGDMKKIGNYTFAECSELTEMVLPVSIESIGSYSFKDCIGLQYISIPPKVTSIGGYTFSGCTALAGLTLPNGLTTIDTYAFQNCSSLTSITVPDSVQTIGAAAFSGCSGLQSMTLPFVGNTVNQTTASSKTVFGFIFGSKSYVGGDAVKQNYSGSGVTYYIPTSLKHVTITGGNLLYGSFYGCSGLTRLTLPDTLTEVGKYAFYQCSGLKELVLPDSVIGIGTYAFAGCSGLRELKLPSKVSKIESYLFSGCTSLEEIQIPDGVTEIGTYAFQNCKGITGMTIPNSVQTIGAAAFSGCSGLQNMTLPFVGYSASATSASSKSLFGYIFGTANYAGGSPVKQYYSSSGSATYYIPASLKNVVITGGTKVLYGSFYNCSGLVRITIPGTVMDIGQKAFYNCSGLLEIVIPQNVMNIAANVFAGCTSLRYVTFAGNAPATIAATAFSGVTATVYYPVSDTTWTDYVGNQYGGTLTWQPHTHSYQPVVTAPTCTEQGYTTHQCTRCNSSYVGEYTNPLGHVSVRDEAVQATCTQTGLTEGSHCSVCGDVIIAQIPTQAAGHRFTKYVSNQDATYDADGTKTAKCNVCEATETIRDADSKLVDSKKPEIEITVGTHKWTGFFHAITFGLFFKETQTVTIRAEDEEKLLDGSTVDRLDQIYYYVSDTEIPSQQLAQVSWKKYAGDVRLDPDRKYIVYAKAVDRSGNTAYASSTGMIVDHTAPQVDGISDGASYCEKAIFQVKDLSLQSVADNGTILKSTDGIYTIAGDGKAHTITAIDDCGNTTELTIVVARQHAWGEPMFTWSDRNKSCAAKFTCTRDQVVKEVECQVQEESPDADCVTAGKVIYTATAILDGIKKTDVRAVSGVALGHDYRAEFVWAENHSTCSASLTCQRAGCSEDTAGHKLSGLKCKVETKTKAANCISEGAREVVASIVQEGVEYSDICQMETIAIDPDNHVHTQIFDRKEPTCLTEGSTGDVYCLDCKQIIKQSKVIAPLPHVWDEGKLLKTATCHETGMMLHTCTSGCGTVWEKETPVDPDRHGNLRVVGAKDATDTEDGYTGDTYCDDCKRIVIMGSVIPAGGKPSQNPGSTERPSPDPEHPDTPTPIPGETEGPTPDPGPGEHPSPAPGGPGTPSPVPGESGGSSTGTGNGKNDLSPNQISRPTTQPGNGAVALTKGSIFASGKLKYKVISTAGGKYTAAVLAPIDRKVKSLKIPATVKINGKVCKITSIAANAFRKCSKLKKVVIGKNVTAIGKNSFYQAKALKSIVVQSTKLSKIGRNALKGISKKAVIQFPKKKQAKYKKLFRKKGQKKTVQIRAV